MVVSGILIGIFGNAFYDMIKNGLKEYIGVDNDELVQSLYKAYEEATRQFYEKYANIFGDKNSSFLARDENWKVIIRKSLYYSENILTGDDLNPKGFENATYASPEAIDFFILVLQKEMLKNTVMNKIITEKKLNEYTRDTLGQILNGVNTLLENNNQLILSDTFETRLKSMLNENQLPYACKELTKFINDLSSFGSCNDWELQFEIRNNEVFITEKPKHGSTDYQNLPGRLDLVMKFPEEYEHFKSIDKIVEYGKKKQIRIKIEILEFRRYIGDHLIEHLKSEFPGQIEMVIPPEPYPIINFDFVFGDEFLKINDIPLQITQLINDDVIEISNKNLLSNQHLVFILTVNIKTGGGSFNFIIPDSKQDDPYSVWLLNKILSCANGTTFRAISNDLQSNPFFQCVVKTDDTASQDFITLLEDILQIQDKLNIDLKLPENISGSDAGLIKHLAMIIREGVDKVFINEDLAWSIEITQELIPNLKELVENVIDGTPIGLKCTKDEEYLLFGQIINIGCVHYILPKIIIKEPDIVAQKLNLAVEGETIQIRISPVDLDQPMIFKYYERFYANEIPSPF